MKLFVFIPLLLLLVCGCHNNNKTEINNTNPEAPAPEAVKKDSFFPVTSFLKGQIRLLDSLPVTPLHTTTINNKTDSEWIKKEVLKTFLSPFLSPEIKETNLVNYFKETSFNDQTLNAITFTYDPLKTLPDSITLRHWDIYIDPETGKVTNIYIVKSIPDKSSIITLQLTWKTDKYAEIVRFLNQPDGNIKLIKKDKFIWKFN